MFSESFWFLPTVQYVPSDCELKFKLFIFPHQLFHVLLVQMSIYTIMQNHMGHYA